MTGKELAAGLNKYLRIRTTPIVLKLCRSKSELDEIPKLRRPNGMFTACQMLGQAARLNYTIGFTADDLTGSQCCGVFGLQPKDIWEDWSYCVGVWVDTEEDAVKHQKYIHTPDVSNGLYEAVALSPLESERIKDPDICIIYATPAQMILFINGLQYKNYENIEATIIGESSCSDSIGKALATGKPCFTIPCFGERRYGGTMEDELIAAMPLPYLEKAIDGLAHLSANGLRYPIPFHGIQHDARAGMSKSYNLDELKKKG